MDAKRARDIKGEYHGETHVSNRAIAAVAPGEHGRLSE
jgi:hypothetical protein